MPKPFGVSGEDALPGLMLEAFGSGRAALLAAVSVAACRFSTLAALVPGAESEVSRNLGRLLAAGLVTKSSAGLYAATPLGRALLAFVAPLRTLAAHAEAFATHAVDGLPTPFLARLDALAAAEVLRDPFQVLGAVERVFAGVETFFYGQWVLGKPLLDGGELAMQRALRERIVDRRADARGILLPHEAPVLRRALPDVDSYVRLRVVPAAPFALAVSDGGALLQFEDRDGRIDFSFAFFGADPVFVAWCRDLFLHSWDAADALP